MRAARCSASWRNHGLVSRARRPAAARAAASGPAHAEGGGGEPAAEPGLRVVVDYDEAKGYDYEAAELLELVLDRCPGFGVESRPARWLGAGCFEVQVCGANLFAEQEVLRLERELGLQLSDLQPGFEDHTYSPEGVVIFSRLTTGTLPDAEREVLPVLQGITRRVLAASVARVEADDGEGA